MEYGFERAVQGGRALLVALILWSVAPDAHAQALVCALPGADPSSPVSGNINTYYPPATNGTLASGSTSLSLGVRDERGSALPIQPGDLILVIQMQDGVLNTSNNANYGAGAGNGQGTSSMGSAGRYEYLRADSVSGSTVTFSPALTHSYVNAAQTTSAGQKRYQIIRVPQYLSVTMQGVTAPPWNGATGGVVVADASNVLTLGSGSVEGQSGRAVYVAGRGFRGGAGIRGTSNSNDQQWRDTANAHGAKGEGIAGTPDRVARKTNNFGLAVSTSGAATLTVDTTNSGYPLGNQARGAPGNAGGGGTEGTYDPSTSTSRNAGGGGGGNYAPGGLGGRPWNAPLNDTGGRGGGGYAGMIGFNRVIMGGGGGAGGTNDRSGDDAAGGYQNEGIPCGGSQNDARALCSSGASGGGIVILRARSFTGTGTIDVRGAHGYNVGSDAAGGGGAGGSVVLEAKEGGSANVDARGGDGGNAWAGHVPSPNTEANRLAERHGPGGGGAGGYVVFSPSNFAVNANLTGGQAGRTTNGIGDTYGSSGNNGGQNGFMPPTAPGVQPGANCVPDLRLAKTNNVDTLNSGGTSNYVLTVSNTGGLSSGTITVVDVLPAGLTVANGAVPLTGAQAANWNCNAAANVLTCTSTTALAQNGSSVFGFSAQVGTVADGSTLTNRARVGGGGDTTKPVPTIANTNACTANNAPAGCALDVDSVNAPLLVLVKTDNTTVVVAGGTTTYQLTVMNAGEAQTNGTIRVVDVLPTGMSYAGPSPFTTAGFTCTYTAGTLSFSCDMAAPLLAGTGAILSLPVNIAANAPTSLTNRARVGGGSDPAKPLPTVATATACPAATPPATTVADQATGCASDTDTVTEVNLALEKDDGQPFMPVNGQTIYQFRVRNTGTADSTGTILFRDVLPAPMNWPDPLVKAGTNATDWICMRVDAQVVSCTSATVIPAGGESQFSLVANVGGVTSGNQYMNRGRIGGGGDPDIPATLDNAAVNSCTGSNVPLGCAVDLNTAQNAAQIRLAKSHPDPQARLPGATFAFTLTVSNTGGSNATAAMRVVDVLPVGLDFASTSPFTMNNFTCSYAAATHSITCNRTAALTAGSSATISFNVTVASGAGIDTLVNRAQVAGGSDPQLGSNTSVTPATALECTGNGTPYLGCAIDQVPVVHSANLWVTKTNGVGSVLLGTTTNYTITVGNDGPATVVDAVMRDPAVPGLQCSTASCIAANGATCPAQSEAALVSALQSGGGAVIPTLPANGTVTVTMNCLVVQP